MEFAEISRFSTKLTFNERCGVRPEIKIGAALGALIVLEGDIGPSDDFCIEFCAVLIDGQTGRGLNWGGMGEDNGSGIRLALESPITKSYIKSHGFWRGAFILAAHEASHVAHIRKGDIVRGTSKMSAHEYLSSWEEVEATKDSLHALKAIEPDRSGVTIFVEPTTGKQVKYSYPQLSKYGWYDFQKLYEQIQKIYDTPKYSR